MPGKSVANSNRSSAGLEQTPTMLHLSLKDAAHCSEEAPVFPFKGSCLHKKVLEFL